MRIRARHYATGELIDLLCKCGRIAAIGPATTTPVDVEASWAAPVLFDLQLNGCSGTSFNSEDLAVDAVRQVVENWRPHGIGGLCPTLVTNALPALARGRAGLRQACEI